MANYICNSRTNYFHVTDEDAYQKLFSHIKAREAELDDYTKQDSDGKLLHAFGAGGEIAYYDDDESDADVDKMLEEIQKLLPNNECFTIIETGAEKMRYLAGSATIVTNKEIRYLGLNNWVRDQARDMSIDTEQCDAMY